MAKSLLLLNDDPYIAQGRTVILAGDHIPVLFGDPKGSSFRVHYRYLQPGIYEKGQVIPAIEHRPLITDEEIAEINAMLSKHRKD